MTRRAKVVVLLGLVAGALAGGGVLAHGRAARHVRAVAKEGDSGSVNCLRCHGPGDRRTAGMAAGPRPTPWDVAVSPDGRAAYVACGPARRIAVVDVAAAEVTAWLPTEGVVSGLDVSRDGRRLAAALEDRDEVVLLDPADGRVLARAAVGTEPKDVVLSADGRRAFVANGGSRDVSVVDLGTGASRRRLAGTEPFVAVLSPDGRRVAVVSRRATIGAADRVPESEVTFLDAATGEVTRRTSLPSCHMTEGAAFTPDGSRLLVPTCVARNLLPILQVARGWVMSAALASIDPESGRVALLPLTDPVRGFPDPGGIAVTADGRRALVAAGGSDEAGLLDLAALRAAEPEAPLDAPQRYDLAPRYVLGRTALGSNPRGVAAAGDRFVVSERLDDAVAVVAADGTVLGRAVLERRPDDPVRRGERAFHDARYAFQGHFSCRSCHPGAHTDGLTYDFEIDGVGRNVVLNRSLLGVAGTEPFKWVGTNPTLERQCGPRFAMVLSRADVFPEGTQKDLVAYLHSLPPPRPDPAAGRVAERDSGAVARGRRLFERFERKDGTPIPPSGRCITCHPPPHYTTRQRLDVGTRGPHDDTGVFDVPHLTGIGSKAPYLHDGRATSLEEIWTLPGVGDQHGVVTDLGKADLNDLVEYMKSL